MKNIFKATLAVAAVAAVGMGSVKAYTSYTASNMSESDLLLAENVLALSDDSRYDIPWKALGEESCTITKVNGGVSIVYKGVTIGPYASYEVEGTKLDCSFWPFATCNPNQITKCSVVK